MATTEGRQPPMPGDIWRDRGDEKHGVIREIEIGWVDGPFVNATGVQSGRTSRIRLACGLLPSRWYRVRAASLMEIAADGETISDVEIFVSALEDS